MSRSEDVTDDEILTNQEMTEEASATARFYLDQALVMTKDLKGPAEARLRLCGDLIHIMAMDFHTMMAERRDLIRRLERN